MRADRERRQKITAALLAGWVSALSAIAGYAQGEETRALAVAVLSVSACAAGVLPLKKNAPRA